MFLRGPGGPCHSFVKCCIFVGTDTDTLWWESNISPQLSRSIERYNNRLFYSIEKKAQIQCKTFNEKKNMWSLWMEEKPLSPAPPCHELKHPEEAPNLSTRKADWHGNVLGSSPSLSFYHVVAASDPHVLVSLGTKTLRVELRNVFLWCRRLEKASERETEVRMLALAASSPGS